MPATTDKLTLGVLGSGSGTNLQAILEATAAPDFPARVACVIADQPDAFILERARRAGIPAFFEDGAPYRTKLADAAEARVIERFRQHGVDTVVLAGFMRIVKSGLLNAFPDRVLNIHPSLLPAFPGMRAWEQAIAYGVRISGCTVHFVDAGMDTGPILLQRAVPVHDDDTPERLHARIQVEEHIAYPEALRLLAGKPLRREGRRVLMRPSRSSS